MSSMASSPLSLTPNALKRLQAIIQQEGEDIFLRVRVDTGGCAGFQYHFLLDNTVLEEDQILPFENSKVVVDNVSLAFLEGAEVDYQEDMIGSTFFIRNPNAASSCGCGTSFSV